LRHRPDDPTPSASSSPLERSRRTFCNVTVGGISTTDAKGIIYLLDTKMVPAKRPRR